MELQDSQARGLHVGSIVLALLLVLAVLFALPGASNATLRLGAIVVLVILIAVQGYLFLQDRQRAHALEEESWTPPAESAPATPTAADQGAFAPPPGAASAPMNIRCKQCSQVFTVQDTGARPLEAACPHCGKTGTIKVRTHAG